jgi:hypothetical protein
MSSRTGTDDGAVTVAFSVAMFTVAETFSIALSLPSTLAAHAAHVIPCTKSSTRSSPDDSPDSEDCPLPNAADDM